MEMLLGGSQDKEAGLHLCSLNRSGAGLLANVSRRTAGIFFFFLRAKRAADDATNFVGAC